MGIGFVTLEGPVTAEIVATGNWEVQVADKIVPATASLKPLYDPTMEKVRA